jgi:hypothetical protein
MYWFQWVLHIRPSPSFWLGWARAFLGRLVGGGWLRQEGRTRAARWLPTDRLTSLDLRFPHLVRLYEHGETLVLEVA